jgi:hypothetical protein
MPASERAWFSEARDFMTSLLANFPGEVERLWKFYFPSICRDMDLCRASACEDLSDNLLGQLIADVLDAKGPKCAICEWGSWVKATTYWDPRFHRRAFVLILLGLEKGLFTAKALAQRASPKTLTQKLESHGAGSSRKVQEKVQQDLGGAGKNTLHSAIHLYAEGWALQREIRRCYLLVLPLHRKYQSMRSEAKSRDNMLEYCRNLTSHAAFEPLLQVWSVLSDAVALKKMGFITNAADIPLAGYAPEAAQGIIAEEARFASKVGMTACCLVGKWLASSLPSLVGLPGKLPALLDKDSSESASARAFLKCMDSWHAAAVEAAKTMPAVAAQVRASFLGDPIPEKTMSLLKAEGFERTLPELKSATEGLFALAQTVMCEQANREARVE